MSKKQKSTQAKANPPITITVTLLDEGDMPRTGQILVQRGTLATIGQFTYTDLSGISQAIQNAAVRLIQLEQDPPPDDVNPHAETPASQSSVEDESDHDAADETEADHVEAEEPSGDLPDQPTDHNQQATLF